VVHPARPQPIAPGDTVRFVRNSQWRFAVVKRVGTKYLHVSLAGYTTKVPIKDATIWRPPSGP